MSMEPAPNQGRRREIDDIRRSFDIEGKLPAIVDLAVMKAGMTAQERLAHYNKEKAEFESALKKWPKEVGDTLRDLLESLRFVDWAHMAPMIMESFRSRGKQSILTKQLHLLYNANKGYDDPEFGNMQIVNRYLSTTRLKPGVRRLLAVHKLAMRGGVASLDHDAVGTLRSVSVVGLESDRGLDERQQCRIDANPYLSFLPDQRVSGGHCLGRILYPEPMGIKPEALERIRLSNPSVHEKVVAFKQLPLVLQCEERDQLTERYRTLTHSLISALLEERYRVFESARAPLAALDTPAAVLKYIRTVALHYRDIISIHPLKDGNGRSVRYESLYAPLDSAGISRPRLGDPNVDLLHSPSDWVREVQRGILSTDALYRDMTRRIRFGMRVESSSELLFPNVVRDVGIELRFRDRARREKNITLRRLDPAQFGAYIDARFLADRSLQSRFRRHPVREMQVLRDDYKEFVKQWNVLCSIPRKGVEQIGIQLVDLDQRAAFGISRRQSLEVWQHKISTWHSSQIVWRGMCDQETAISTEECLRLFTTPGTISLANNIAALGETNIKSMLKGVHREFDRYNHDVISGDLYRQVIDHVEEGPGYASSYGLSTSRTWGVAAGFAWGRGTFGYDNSVVAQQQPMIKSRIVVGAYQAVRDIDVRRFRILDARFSYKFGRQQEILAIGGLDPDAIMVVQLLDPRRHIDRSFVRNLLDPSEVYEIRGGFHPATAGVELIPEAEIIARHRI